MAQGKSPFYPAPPVAPLTHMVRRPHIPPVVALIIVLLALLFALLWPAPAGAVLTIRRVHVDTFVGQYLVIGGAAPTVDRGTITYLACAPDPAPNDCAAYVVTITGRCRRWRVGALVVEDRRCAYLPSLTTRGR